MSHNGNPILSGPKAKDGFLTYYAHVMPENLVVWASTAMKNSYSPYSGRKEGVLIRTERGDISVGTNVETINWDGLTAIEVAIGRLFVQQPWVDNKNRPEKISNIIYALEDFDPGNPDSYVPDGRSLDWLRKFGSPDTVLHFAIPERGILASKTLHEVLPHGPRMTPLKDYFNGVGDFNRFLRTAQDKPEEIDMRVWHGLRRSRLHAFAPYSNYRVGVVIEADSTPIAQEYWQEMHDALNKIGMTNEQKAVILHEIFQKTTMFAGINVELSGNSGLHGEGCAIGAMITDLGPKAKLERVYLQGGFEKGADDCTSCGKCRQLITEFSTATTQIITISETDVLPGMSRDCLLPGVFAKLG